MWVVLRGRLVGRDGTCLGRVGGASGDQLQVSELGVRDRR